MLDCLVIGAGHCGLLCADLLAQAGLHYGVVEAAPRAGQVWRERPRRLRLFTSRRFCRLGDLAMEGDPDGFPSAGEFADHVERFARDRELLVRFETRVTRLSRDAPGFVAELNDGDTIRSATVINATGSNQRPRVPDFARRLHPRVRQIVAPAFRDADDLAPGSRVVVVGDGASGRQIAQELAPDRQVSLACGRKRKLVPNVVLGRDVFWWLDKTGLLHAGRDTLAARILRRRDPIPVASASNARLLAAGVAIRPRAIDAQGSELIFDDGSRQAADAVVWCGGYRENLDWIDLPGIRDAESLGGGQGRTPEAGFYVVGRKWLTCRASELILGAERDARRVTGHVIEEIRAARRAAARDGEALAHV